MIGASVMRELGLATGGSDDVVSWLCAAAGFFGMAHTFKRGDFVRVTLFIESLGARARRSLEIACLCIGSAFAAFLFWAALRFVYESWAFGDMANGLVAIRLWIPQSSFVAGAALLLVAVIDELVLVLRGHRPSYVTALEERHARGDFTEDM
ncbi:MAG: TRAP transporter small permease [Elusimicrobia bacterium]|nr:TRAP transporter small permease [Elusimicrobiota bacterium]